MSDVLDQEILSVMQEFHHGDPDHAVDSIEAIKRVFINAGYRKNYAANFGDKAYLRELRDMQGYMTGQEWLDRFEKELKGKAFAMNSGSWEFYKKSDIHMAARRVAGLSKGE